MKKSNVLIVSSSVVFLVCEHIEQGNNIFSIYSRIMLPNKERVKYWILVAVKCVKLTDTVSVGLIVI